MIWRLLNLVAVLGLLGSSVYAYTVKYDSILFAEQILQARHQIAAEQDQIDRLRAELALLTRPERLQALADKSLGLKPLSLDQIVRVTDLPDRPPRTDSIGRKLADLGLSEPTNTPTDRTAHGSAATPAADRTR